MDQNLFYKCQPEIINSYDLLVTKFFLSIAELIIQFI